MPTSSAVTGGGQRRRWTSPAPTRSAAWPVTLDQDTSTRGFIHHTARTAAWSAKAIRSVSLGLFARVEYRPMGQAEINREQALAAFTTSPA